MIHSWTTRATSGSRTSSARGGCAGGRSAGSGRGSGRARGCRAGRVDGAQDPSRLLGRSPRRRARADALGHGAARRPARGGRAGAARARAGARVVTLELTAKGARRAHASRPPVQRRSRGSSATSTARSARVDAAGREDRRDGRRGLGTGAAPLPALRPRGVPRGRRVVPARRPHGRLGVDRDRSSRRGPLEASRDVAGRRVRTPSCRTPTAVQSPRR